MPYDALAAARQLARNDPVLARLVKEAGPCTLRPRRGGLDHFGALARSIVYQQLAGNAAASIHGRLLKALGSPLRPAAVLAADPLQLRAAGMSGSKAAALTSLSSAVLDGTVPVHRLGRLSDDAVVERLSQVRGIGRWTAEMFLMFQLGRPDVWPVTDYGVRNGYRLAWTLDELPAPRILEELGEQFRPYRSVAAWYCWRAVDLYGGRKIVLPT